MATFVLIPGADGRAWYWHRLIPLLDQRGQQAIAVELPVSDASAGFDRYTAAVVDAIGDRKSDLILVAQSLAGFIAPLVAERVPVRGIVLLNAMVPKSGETAGAWWDNTGQGAARAKYYEQSGLQMPEQFDVFEAFFHDAPPDVLAAAMAIGEQPSRFDRLFAEPWPLESWPDVPTRVLQGRDDRFFPLAFQERVVEERLGIPVEVLPGGHLLALSRPVELADSLTK